ncbi:MAG: biotin/lipoyl-binding protein [Alphaproteobacteria bacterium]|nr:biotin/lipoyl-binding protein [Alphaproteobacteria bacterium]
MKFRPIEALKHRPRSIVFLLLLLFFPVPMWIEGTFSVESTAGPHPLRAMYDGLIVSVEVSEGTHVEEGEVIFTLHSTEWLDRLNTAKEWEANAKWSDERRDLLEQGKTALSEANRIDQDRLIKRRQLRSLNHEYYKSELDFRAWDLNSLDRQLKSPTVSERDHLATRVAHEKASLDLESASVEMTENDLELRKNQLEFSVDIISYEDTISQLGESIDINRYRLKKLQDVVGWMGEDVLEVRAPCSGNVVTLLSNHTGLVISDEDVLGHIVCDNGIRRIRVYANVNHLHLVEPGTRIRLRPSDSGLWSSQAVWTTVTFISEGAIESSLGNSQVVLDVVPLAHEQGLRWFGVRGDADGIVCFRPLGLYLLSPVLNTLDAVFMYLS